MQARASTPSRIDRACNIMWPSALAENSFLHTKYHWVPIPFGYCFFLERKRAHTQRPRLSSMFSGPDRSGAVRFGAVRTGPDRSGQVRGPDRVGTCSWDEAGVLEHSATGKWPPNWLWVNFLMPGAINVFCVYWLRVNFLIPGRNHGIRR